MKGQEIISNVCGRVCAVRYHPQNLTPRNNYRAEVLSVYLKEGRPRYTVRLIAYSVGHGKVAIDYRPCPEEGQVVDVDTLDYISLS